MSREGLNFDEMDGQSKARQGKKKRGRKGCICVYVKSGQAGIFS